MYIDTIGYVDEMYKRKELEVFGGHLLSEDDHSHLAPPYWNIMKETFSSGRTEVTEV